MKNKEMEKLKQELNKMILEGYDYEDILKKSQELDKYIIINIKQKIKEV